MLVCTKFTNLVYYPGQGTAVLEYLVSGILDLVSLYT
jgi:hypothetical protein